MSSKYLSLLTFAVLFSVQFIVVPTFSLMAQGGKAATMSLFIVFLTACMLVQNREWDVPKALIPLICLVFVFLLSLLLSQWPALGMPELFLYSVGLLFCFLVSNLSKDSNILREGVFTWFRIIGLIVAFLCIYQFIDWILAGQKDTMLIHYLLPPGNSRVTGIYGQPNLTALLLLVSIIAYSRNYLSRNETGYRLKNFCHDIAFLLVSTAFFLTRSRAGSVAFFVVLTVLVLLNYRGKIAFHKQSFLRFILILSAGFVITQIPFSVEVSDEMYTRSGISTDARFLFWTASVLMFVRSPFIGVGLDHFKLFLPSYSRQAHDLLGFVQYEAMGYTRWSHNEYFQILAEAGIVGFVLLIVFFILLVRLILIETFQARPDGKKLFLFLMMLPFFVQGMFSWPFRHPALLFIFFLILGIAIAETPAIRMKFTKVVRLFFAGLLLISVIAVVVVSFKEYQLVQLQGFVKDNGCDNNELFSLIDDPYLEFKILREVLPLCLADESFFDDQSLVARVEPYFSKIANLQGTYRQWYNLGLLHRSLGEHGKAKAALQKSVERQPVFEKGWFVLHALNIEEAVRKTGRPVEDFLPPEKKSSEDVYNLIIKETAEETLK